MDNDKYITKTKATPSQAQAKNNMPGRNAH